MIHYVLKLIKRPSTKQTWQEAEAGWDSWADCQWTHNESRTRTLSTVSNLLIWSHCGIGEDAAFSWNGLQKKKDTS